MSWIGLWLRVELRCRWRSIVTLALLVAVASAVVMTAAAAARRGSTAIDRLLVRTDPATVAVLLNEPRFDWERVRHLDGVEGLTTFALGEYTVDEVPPEQADDALGFASADAEVWRSIERPVVLSGRVPDPSRADEVAVSSRFPATFGRGVGDTVTLRLFTPEQMDVAPGDKPAGGPEGPVIEARIVGVIRSPWYHDNLGATGTLFPSPGLLRHYEANILGTQRNHYVNALVRLEGGAAGIPDFKRRLADATGREDVDVWDLREPADHLRDVSRFDAGALLVFAAAAAIASLVLIGQAVARYASVSAADLDVWNALGFSPREALRAAALGPTAAAAVGAVAGGATSVWASRWFPRGAAGLVEPSPGVAVDPVVQVGGALAAVLAVALWSARPAARSLRKDQPASARSPRWMRTVTADVPVPVALGAHFALDPSQGRHAVPARSALFGAMVGVAGVIGALTFSTGVNDATSTYDRVGQTYDLVTFFGINGEDFAPSQEILDATARTPGVEAVNDARMHVAESGSHSVSLYELAPVGTGIEIVVPEGRLPQRAGEIVLGPRTAEAMGVSVGDSVTLGGEAGDVQLAVTGLAFMPAGPHNEYASGGWVTRADYDRLFDGFKFHFGLVGIAPDSSADEVAARLAKELQVEFVTGPIIPPTEVAELRQVRSLPMLLAGFLALLALGALGHTLSSTVRRRKGDLAVLRTLGMTRRAVGAVVVTQASIIAVAGFVVGIPLGAAIGRIVWGFVASYTPVEYLTPWAWLAVAVTPFAALLAANVLAAWPSRRARSFHLASALRVE